MECTRLLSYSYSFFPSFILCARSCNILACCISAFSSSLSIDALSASMRDAISCDRASSITTLNFFLISFFFAAACLRTLLSSFVNAAFAFWRISVSQLINRFFASPSVPPLSCSRCSSYSAIPSSRSPWSAISSRSLSISGLNGLLPLVTRENVSDAVTLFLLFMSSSILGKTKRFTLFEELASLVVNLTLFSSIFRT